MDDNSGGGNEGHSKCDCSMKEVITKLSDGFSLDEHALDNTRVRAGASFPGDFERRDERGDEGIIGRLGTISELGCDTVVRREVKKEGVGDQEETMSRCNLATIKPKEQPSREEIRNNNNNISTIGSGQPSLTSSTLGNAHSVGNWRRGKSSTQSNDSEGTDRNANTITRIVPEKMVDGSREDYAELGERLLGYRFRDGHLLRQALTHGSWNEAGGGAKSQANPEMMAKYADYERLEFLGDAVLKLVHASILFRDHNDWSEGRLTSVKQLYEQNSNLLLWTKQIGLDRHVRCGASIQKDPTGCSNIFANVFESVLGAIYLDCGYNFNTVFDVYQSWGLSSPEVLHQNFERNGSGGGGSDAYNTAGGCVAIPIVITNPRQTLQEFLQKRSLPLPVFIDVGKDGSGHAPIFTRMCSAVIEQDPGPALAPAPANSTSTTSASSSSDARCGDGGKGNCQWRPWLIDGCVVGRERVVSTSGTGATKKDADKEAARGLYEILKSLKLPS